MMNSGILWEALEDVPELAEAFTDFRAILADELRDKHPFLPLEVAEVEADEVLAAMVESRFIDALLGHWA